MSPASALALGTSTMGIFCALTGIIGPEGFLTLGIWLIGGFAIHLYASISAWNQGNALEAGVFSFFGVYLELVGAISFITTWAVIQFNLPAGFFLDGFMWIPLTIGIWFWSYPLFKLCPGTLSIGILFADIAFPLVTLTKLGVLGAPFELIAGVCILLTSVFFMYLGGASMINVVFEKDILPLGGPILKTKK